MDIELKDKWNNRIRLTRERIKHIANHLELYDKLQIVEETLKSPDKVTNDPQRQDLYYYQKYLKQEDLFLIVLVKKEHGEGFIITIFKSNKLKETQ